VETYQAAESTTAAAHGMIAQPVGWWEWSHATSSLKGLLRRTLIGPEWKHKKREDAKGQRTKGKGLGLKVLGKTEADAEVPGVGVEPVPGRRTQIPRTVEPGTAADHALAAVTSLRL